VAHITSAHIPWARTQSDGLYICKRDWKCPLECAQEEKETEFGEHIVSAITNNPYPQIADGTEF
jgi:hypothetical protein